MFRPHRAILRPLVAFRNESCDLTVVNKAYIDIGALSPAVKQLGYEANHSPPSTAKLRMNGVAPPLPHMPS
jgi:hypothetical protein